ncbi:ATPase [Deferribacter autotrophicus]|uniref:ATPase n=1 Tax=Deferribacter autotrophicus TaxID=500465 RepID=A0A5A8F5W2_9BACT|nr:NifB/NifX family molybdenum-iron cluster-binding protein [Deferribacter autotrophicus]KAA0257048.1 ATPase [Deferribacter autotrophicus]
MKIAIPLTEDNRISEHFGHASKFFIATVENENIVESNYYVAPAHQFGSYPMWLISQGVGVLLCKGIGHKAVEMLESKGIEVFSNVPGYNPTEAIEKFLKSELTKVGGFCSGGNSCH